MNELEKKYEQVRKTLGLIKQYKKMSSERRGELKLIVINYLNLLDNDELRRLLKKAMEEGEGKPDLCDEIICAFFAVLDDIIFGEIVKLIIKFDLSHAKSEEFKYLPKYKIPGDR